MSALWLSLLLMFVIIIQSGLAQPCSKDDVAGGDLGGNDTIDNNLSTSTFGTLCGFIWLDLDCDGIQDYDEPGVCNLAVNLYRDIDIFIETTKTDVTGSYNFKGLEPGNYWLEFVLPQGYKFTFRNQGVNDSVDSNGIGATVWNDFHDDGVKDRNKSQIVGVECYLYDSNGHYYEFQSLIAGNYSVRFSPCFHIDSDPEGASILIDGKTITEKTPNDIDCPLIFDNVTISFEDYENHIPVDFGVTYYTKFHIESNPSDADILIDGKTIMEKTPSDVYCHPGPHDVVVYFDELKTDTRKIFVKITPCD